MFDTRVLAFSVLTNENSVDIVVRSLEAVDGDARSYVGEEEERSSQCQVEGDVTLPNCRLLHRNQVSA